MCHFALVGAQTGAAELRRILRANDCDLDADVCIAPEAVAYFPATDTVMCVTRQGCSCALLEGVGLTRDSKRSVHLAGPGYMFRRGLAAAALRYGSIRLLAYNAAMAATARVAPRRRTTTLGQFLRAGLLPNDEIVCIVA